MAQDETEQQQREMAEEATDSESGIDRYAVKAATASSLGYAMDGFDFLILSFALTAITGSLGLTGTQAGSLATLTLFGAVVGGILFGVLSDYMGRVKLLALTILIFALFTALTAVSQNYAQIAVFRFIAGLGLGGEFGIGMTLVAEAWPARYRARATSLVALGWQVGVLLAAVVSTALITLIDWRGLFLVGALPALFAWYVRRSMDEPEMFVDRQNSQSQTRQGFPIRLLFNNAATLKISIGMIILCGIQNFGYYGFITWLPSYLSNNLGYGVVQSGTWTILSIVGMLVGIMVFGILADRYGRKPIFYIFQAGAAISVIVYSQLSGPIALLLGGIVLGVFVNGMLGGYGALMAELYPTEARATAQNVLFNIGRAIGGLGPLVFGALSGTIGFATVVGFLAVLYVADIIATAVLIPERRGAQLA